MTAPDNQNNSEWEPRPMASDVEKRIAKALLSARSHIGSCRPDYDEDDAAWWDELTELAELVTQPAVGEAITSNASLAGEAVAGIICEAPHTDAEWTDYGHTLPPGTKLYAHPPAAEVREVDAESLLDALDRAVSVNIREGGPFRPHALAALRATLQKEKVNA